MSDDPTWEELAATEGINPDRIDDYINAQVRAHYPKPKRQRKPRPQMIQWPARIPTADGMLDDLDEWGISTGWLESLIFNSWLMVKARREGLRPMTTTRSSEFVRRYYGENAPPRLRDK